MAETQEGAEEQGPGQRRWRLWLIAAAVALLVIVGGAAGVLLLWPSVSLSPARAARLPTASITVQRGTVTTTVQATGVLVASVRPALSFQTAGRLREIAVDVGQTVQAGQVLARLETPDLEAAVAQAAAAVELAEARVALARLGSQPEELRVAAAVVEAARAASIRAEDAGTTGEVAQARAALQVTQVRLAQLRAAAEHDEAAAIAAVTAARARHEQARAGARSEEVAAAAAAFEAAELRHRQSQAGVSPEDVAAATADLRRAQTEYEQTQATEAELRTARAALAAAQARLDAWLTPAPAALRAADARVAAAKALLAALRTPHPEDVAAAQAALDQAQTRSAQLLDAPPVAAEDVRAGELQVEAARVALEQAQTALGTDTTTLRSTLEASVKQGKINLELALNSLNRVRAQGPTEWEIRLQQQAVTAAQAALDRILHPSAADVAAAEATLAQAEIAAAKLRSPAPQTVAAAQLAVIEAEAQLERLRAGDPLAVDIAAAERTRAQAQLERLRAGDPFAVGVAAAQVAQAAAQLDRLQEGDPHEIAIAAAQLQETQAQLDRWRVTRRFDIQAAEAAVDQAEAALAHARQNQEYDRQRASAVLAQAQAQFDLQRRGPLPEELAVAGAEVSMAESQAQSARLALAAAALRAPFAGTVAQISAIAGEWTQPNTPVVTLVDPKALRAELLVDETDVTRVQPGQKATIALHALPGTVLRGQVVAASPLPTVQQGLILYPVRLAVEAPPDLAIRPGMAATATISIATQENALVVPTRAVRSQGDTRVVHVIIDGHPVRQPVQIGLVGNGLSEIVAGLQAGEHVLLPAPTSGRAQLMEPGTAP